MTLLDLMTVGTMYQAKNKEDENLFALWADIVLDERLDKQELIRLLIDDCARMTPLTQTFETFKDMSDRFFKRYEYQIRKLVDTMYLDYNPIWNVDGDVWESRDTERQRDTERTLSGNDTDTHTDKTTYNDTTEHTVSADNASDYQPHSKDASNGGDDKSGNYTRTRKDTEGTGEHENIGDVFHQRREGNIGVTTTQKMINEERELLEFNIYNWISKKYQADLFIQVW